MRVRAALAAALAACALGAGALAGCGGGGGGGQHTLRVGYAFGFDIGDVGDRVGFARLADKEGIDVRYQETSGGPNAIASLLRGDIDLANLAIADVLNAVRAGADVRAIMISASAPEFVFVARPPFDAPSKLKGARVGLFARSPSTTALTKLLLHRGGLGLDDVEVRPLADSPSRAAALASKRIDATMLEYVDYLHVAPKVPGLKILARVGDLAPAQITTVFAVSGSYARSHRELLRKAVGGLQDGYRELYKPGGRAAFVSQAKRAHIGEKPPLVAEVYDYYRRIRIWPTGLGLVTPATHDRTQRFYLDAGTVEKPVAFDKVWDLSFWRAAG